MSNWFKNEETGKRILVTKTLRIHVYDEDLDFVDDYEGIIDWLMETNNEPMCWLERNDDGKFIVASDYVSDCQDEHSPSVDELEDLCDWLNDAKDFKEMCEALSRTGMNGCDWDTEEIYNVYEENEVQS